MQAEKMILEKSMDHEYSGIDGIPSFRNKCIELGYGSDEPTSLAMDNQAGRDLAYNPQHHPRTKHIGLRADISLSARKWKITP